MVLQNQSDSAGCCSLASHNFSQTFSETSICHRAMTHVAVSSACFVFFLLFLLHLLTPPAALLLLSFFLSFICLCLHNFPGDRAQIRQPPSEDLNRRQLECIHKYGRKFPGKFCNLDVFRETLQPDFNSKEEQTMREPLQLALRPSHCRLSHVYLSPFAVCECVCVCEHMCEAE